MSRKSRMKDVREAKDRRAKRLVIGGAVLLVAVLAFEMPKVLKGHGGSSSSTPPAATTTTTPSYGASTTPTSTPVASTAVLPATSAKLTTSDLSPRRSKSELYSFSHFAGKDPFVQQVSASDITSSPSGNSGASGVITAGPAPSAQTTSARMLARTGAVTLQVNGKTQTVRIGGSFPSSNPLFKLVSVSHGLVRIGIASGSYQSGAQTVTLVSGRTMTLVDTADGVRYRIRLLSAS
ncbi:MAG: hypothetical protein ACJ752_02260 [Gaiellaceae bacterium]